MFADLPRPAADITGDNVVDLEELAVMAQSWLLDSNSPGFDPNADLDGSGAIDFVDFAILANYWRDEGEPGGWYFYHYDGLGSVVALSDDSGQITEQYRYDVFGMATILSPSNEQRAASNFGNCRMFTGREYDPETGNYYYRARYYNAGVGRFLQADPIGYKEGLNLYTYCGNNPIIWVDPYGDLYARRQLSKAYDNPFVTIKTQDGSKTTYQVSSRWDLNNILNDKAGPDNKIVNLTIVGHGVDGMISIGNTLLAGDNSSLGIASASDPTLRDTIKRNFAPDAEIFLRACESAKGEKSIAAEFKSLLPSATVKGYEGKAWPIGLEGSLGIFNSMTDVENKGNKRS